MVTVTSVLLVALGRTSGTVTVKRVNLSSLCECLLLKKNSSLAFLKPDEF